MCCGQKRRELRSFPTAAAIRNSTTGNPTNVQAPGARMRVPAMAPLGAGPVHSAVGMPTQGRPLPANMPGAGLRPTTSLHYADTPPVRVRGAVTGMYYEFSGSRPVQQVDSRDAASLLNTRFFRRA